MPVAAVAVQVSRSGLPLHSVLSSVDQSTGDGHIVDRGVGINSVSNMFSTGPCNSGDGAARDGDLSAARRGSATNARTAFATCRLDDAAAYDDDTIGGYGGGTAADTGSTDPACSGYVPVDGDGSCHGSRSNAGGF